jgi:uncharacterized protein (UPF0212 family)
LFGSDLEATAKCPACGERLELAFSTRDVMTDITIGALPAARESHRVRVQTGEYEILCRALCSADLADSPDRATLLERCVETAQRNGLDVRLSDLPEEAMIAIGEAIRKADPHAEIDIALNCPACGHQWQSLFDIAAFLWGEIEDWAQRLLLDVHLLASAYGWSEREILSMSPRRRGLYLEMAGAA